MTTGATTNGQHERVMLTVVEASKLTGVGKNRVYEYINTGVWPSVQIGRKRLIPYHKLIDWINAHTQGGV